MSRRCGYAITPMRFRTTVLTDIYEQTGDIKLTQQAAGHATPDITMKHYVKGRKKANDAARVIDCIYTTPAGCLFPSPFDNRFDGDKSPQSQQNQGFPGT